MYEQVPTTTLGFTLWVILEQDKWMRMDNACWGSVVTTASVSTTSTSKLSIITECPGYTADQIIGINATTSLQRGLPYPVSSLTQPLQCGLWHQPFSGVQQSETAVKENLPYKNCKKL